MRRAALFVVLVVAIACGRSGFSPDNAAPSFGLPLPRWPYEDLGDGHDGELVVMAGIREINRCRYLAWASNATAVVIGTDSLAAPGRRVLVWQVQDDFALTSGSPADVIAGEIGDAGLFELARISLVAGTNLTLDPPLALRYSSVAPGQRRAQVCMIPEYTRVFVGSNATLTGDSYSANAGGILAFFAQGEIVIDGLAEADADGFNGGVPRPGPQTGAGITAEDTVPAEGGGKGESLQGLSFFRSGRGNWTNGGGGGNGNQAGGGGGGNGGAGGAGGFEANPGNPATAGRPGSRVAIDWPDRLVLGGGGGAGHWDSEANGAGGDGGGVVWITGASLAGRGAIRARGEPGENGVGLTGGVGPTYDSDGAGGGGAGGTIILRTAVASTFTGIVEASGADGGNPLGGGPEGGPGGGGGGGVVVLEGVTLSLGANVAPGAHGSNDGPGFSIRNSADGVPGRVLERPSLFEQ